MFRQGFRILSKNKSKVLPICIAVPITYNYISIKRYREEEYNFLNYIIEYLPNYHNIEYDRTKSVLKRNKFDPEFITKNILLFDKHIINYIIANLDREQLKTFVKQNGQYFYTLNWNFLFEQLNVTQEILDEFDEPRLTKIYINRMNPKDITIPFIKKYKDHVLMIDIISKKGEFPDDYIQEFDQLLSKREWEELIYIYKASDDFIKKYSSKITTHRLWSYVCKLRGYDDNIIAQYNENFTDEDLLNITLNKEILTDEFIEKYKDKLFFNIIISCKEETSDEFIDKYKQYFNHKAWHQILIRRHDNQLYEKFGQYIQFPVSKHYNKHFKIYVPPLLSLEELSCYDILQHIFVPIIPEPETLSQKSWENITKADQGERIYYIDDKYIVMMSGITIDFKHPVFIQIWNEKYGQYYKL